MLWEFTFVTVSPGCCRQHLKIRCTCSAIEAGRRRLRANGLLLVARSYEQKTLRLLIISITCKESMKADATHQNFPIPVAASLPANAPAFLSAVFSEPQVTFCVSSARLLVTPQWTSALLLECALTASEDAEVGWPRNFRPHHCRISVASRVRRGRQQPRDLSPPRRMRSSKTWNIRVFAVVATLQNFQVSFPIVKVLCIAPDLYLFATLCRNYLYVHHRNRAPCAVVDGATGENLLYAARYHLLQAVHERRITRRNKTNKESHAASPGNSAV